MMRRLELVFVPTPAIGHLVSTLEFCKLLVECNDRLSITVLLIKLPFDPMVPNYVRSVAASIPSDSPIRFIELPGNEQESFTLSKTVLVSMIESNRSQVRQAVAELISNGQSDDGGAPRRLAGFVLDLLCVSMIDVANEFGVPSYIFSTSGAAFVGLMLHIQDLYDNQGMVPIEFKDSEAELILPGFVNPLPAKVMPSTMLDKDWLRVILSIARRFRETKGILINTFSELEPLAISALNEARTSTKTKTKTPPVYPVGPILNLKGMDQIDGGKDINRRKEEIIRWLDRQPPSSVLYLCFGSTGSFSVDQVREISSALEHSGHRFLWSLRKPPSKNKLEAPTDYSGHEHVLPDGFLDRTAGVGKIIGWAPQVDILAHAAIGGFVSHCGWNSILESVWYGVPIATWPLLTDQLFNAFEMVVELGLGVEVKMDYRRDGVIFGIKEDFVTAEQIGRSIQCVMDHDSERTKRVKEMSEKSKMAMMDGGSSRTSIANLIKDIMDNIS